MHTDLRDLLPVVEAGAPPLRHTADDVLTAARRRRNRRRAVVASTAAVLLIGVGVAVPQLVATGPPVVTAVPAPFAYPAAEWSGTIPAYTAGQLTVSGTVRVTPGYQVAEITDGVHRNDRGALVPVALLTVFRPGVFDPGAYLGGEPVLINGRPGRYVAGVAYNQWSNAEPAVLWEYQENAYALVTDLGVPRPVTREQMAAVAVALTPGPETPVRVPFRLSYVPAGYSVAVAGTDRGRGYLELITGGYPRSLRGAGIDRGREILRLTLLPAAEAKADSATCTGSSSCYRPVIDGRMLEVVGNGYQSEAELRRVLDGILVSRAGYPVGEAVR